MKLKDLFTLGNLLCGFLSVVVLFHGYFDWACYLIYIAYVFDVLDGPVARLTKQFDKFGSVFDTVSDFITNSIAVSFIIYYAFWKNANYHWILAAAIAAFPFCFGTIRQAKSMERELSYPCYWLGIPRPVLAIFVLAMLNSSLCTVNISPWREIGYAVAAILVVVLSVLHLSKIPFVNHNERRWMNALFFGMHVFLTGTPIAFVLGWVFLDSPAFVYDYVLFCLIIYLFVSWTQIPRVDIQRIRTYVAGGPLVKPLVHRDNTWRSKSFADFFSVKNAD
ncbi:MAG: CDP-alcohol phosphatidyltransferase family protein [Pseudomonadota bacterium]